MNINDLIKELKFKSGLSSGPGGQHVNKVSSKIELSFDIEASEYLDDEEKQRIKTKLKNKVNKQGILKISSQRYRSSFKNKEDCIIKFEKLIKKALFVRKKRLKRKISKAENEKRLKIKKEQAEKKERRKKID